MNKEECIQYIKEKHKGQKRTQGTPYATHPIAVSNLLQEKGFPMDYQMAGLLHDVLEDTDATYEEIEKRTNQQIANAVKLVTKEQGYTMNDYMERIKNNPMARMVKLADRIHNLAETQYCSIDFQKKYIKETEEWYMDLAKGTIFEKDLKKVLSDLKDNFIHSCKKIGKK